MLDILTQFIFGLVPIVDSLGDWVYAIIFFATIIESTPGIGTFTPGTIFMVFFGFLISISDLNLIFCIIIATCGAMVGDSLGYLLGRFGQRFFKEHKGILRKKHLELGREFFSHHGGKSIFIGRFVGVVRPIVPLVAGAVHMSMRRFVPLNMLSALLWSGILITIGFFVGEQWSSVETWVSRISVALGVLVMIGIYLYIRGVHKRHKKRFHSVL